MNFQPFTFGKRFITASVLFLALIGVLPFHSAEAVSLGKAEVRSKMGQPFDAIIPIRASASEGGGLIVRLANGLEYEKLGVDYSYFLSKIEGKMILDAKLLPTSLHVFSKTPLFEPEIRVIIDATWPEGRFLRSYVMLVQPSENIYNAAQSAIRAGDAQSGGMSTLPGEVKVIREDEPSPEAMPLVDQYWGNPSLPALAPAVKHRKVVKKRVRQTKTSVAANTPELAAKKQELESLNDRIKEVQAQLK